MKVSTHMGLEGISLTMAASPDLMNLGSSSMFLPVRRSILLEELGELAGNVGSVAIEHGGVAGADLAGVVQDDDLGGEVVGLLGGSFLESPATLPRRISLTETFLTLKPTLSPGTASGSGLVVHLDGLDFSGDVGGGEGDDHAGLEDASLDTADGDGADTADLVDVLEGQAQGLVGGALGGLDGMSRASGGWGPCTRACWRDLHHVVAVQPEMGMKGTLSGL